MKFRLDSRQRARGRKSIALHRISNYRPLAARPPNMRPLAATVTQVSSVTAGASSLQFLPNAGGRTTAESRELTAIPKKETR